MRRLFSKACYAGAVVVGVSVFVAGFLAYFIFKYDPTTQQTFDGLGRTLGPSPLFMRFIFDEDRLWAGWTWWTVDMIWFWGGIGVAYLLFKLGEKIKG